MISATALPPGVTVFERGWLSANGILFTGSARAALVDSGYYSHRAQTVALLEQALGDRPLDLLLNTHLHSDHCGGNHALQQRYPEMHTLIPPGEAAAVARWDDDVLSYQPTGQICERFSFDGLLQPGSGIELSDRIWEVHAAPGHDAHSIILFEPQSRCLISADALWQNGFGVVFPELIGEPGFDEVEKTLDLIEHLQPALIIPGHGSVFTDASQALLVARRRLNQFAADPVRHAMHAAKVLLKFKLLELQQVRVTDFVRWCAGTPYLQALHEKHFPEQSMDAWIQALIESLQHSEVAALEHQDGTETLVNR